MSQNFTLDYLMSQKKDILKYLQEVKRKNKESAPGAPRFYLLQEKESDGVLCSLSSSFYFVGDKISADCFKYEITRSSK